MLPQCTVLNNGSLHLFHHTVILQALHKQPYRFSHKNTADAATAAAMWQPGRGDTHNHHHISHSWLCTAKLLYSVHCWLFVLENYKCTFMWIYTSISTINHPLILTIIQFHSSELIIPIVTLASTEDRLTNFLRVHKIN